MQIELTILIPVYNEVNLLEKFVKNLVNTFKKKLIKFVFVDDGSTDGSNEWLSKNIPIICKLYKYDLILLKKNVGKGFAIRQGIKKIEGDYVLCIDSDHEYDPKDGLEIYEIAKKNYNCLNESLIYFKSSKKFDLVITSGVLIHQSPKLLKKIIRMKYVSRFNQMALDYIDGITGYHCLCITYSE